MFLSRPLVREEAADLELSKFTLPGFIKKTVVFSTLGNQENKSPSRLLLLICASLVFSVFPSPYERPVTVDLPRGIVNILRRDVAQTLVQFRRFVQKP